MAWALVRHGEGRPRQVEEEANSATLEKVKGYGLMRRLLSPPLRGCVFQARRLAFPCQLSQRPGVGKRRTWEPRVTKALGCCRGGP